MDLILLCDLIITKLIIIILVMDALNIPLGGTTQTTRETEVKNNKSEKNDEK